MVHTSGIFIKLKGNDYNMFTITDNFFKSYEIMEEGSSFLHVMEKIGGYEYIFKLAEYEGEKIIVTIDDFTSRPIAVDVYYNDPVIDNIDNLVFLGEKNLEIVTLDKAVESGISILRMYLSNREYEELENYISKLEWFKDI